MFLRCFQPILSSFSSSFNSCCYPYKKKLIMPGKLYHFPHRSLPNICKSTPGIPSSRICSSSSVHCSWLWTNMSFPLSQTQHIWQSIHLQLLCSIFCSIFFLKYLSFNCNITCITHIMYVYTYSNTYMYIYTCIPWLHTT